MRRPYNINNGFYRLGPVFGAVDDDPILFCLADKLFELFFEVFDHLRADGVGLLPAFTPVRQGGKRVEASLCAAFGVVVERSL